MFSIENKTVLTGMFALALAALIGCASQRNVGVKTLSIDQVKSLADAAVVSAGYQPQEWVQQFVINVYTSKVWRVTYCNRFPPTIEYAGFTVTVHDETRETSITNKWGR